MNLGLPSTVESGQDEEIVPILPEGSVYSLQFSSHCISPHPPSYCRFLPATFFSCSHIIPYLYSFLTLHLLPRRIASLYTVGFLFLSLDGLEAIYDSTRILDLIVNYIKIVSIIRNYLL